MTKEVLIFGSGSIGNHLANACRQVNLTVNITDISFDALMRMKNKIYPSRYSKWDKNIKLINYNEVFKLKKNFDLVMVGTPPITHNDLIKKIFANLNFEKIMIEKPFTSHKIKFNEKKLHLLSTKKKIFIGYNHSISKAFEYFRRSIANINKDNIKMINVKWQEGWKGILNAHYWNKNEYSTYLGNLAYGGGCTHEHSHGLHIIVCLSDILKFKLPKKLFYFRHLEKKNTKIYYDSYVNVSWQIKNFSINYVSDLISEPANKSVCIYTKNNKFELIFNFNKKYDLVKKTDLKTNLTILKYFKKKRSVDFVNEINHIYKVNTSKQYKESFVNLKKGLETQMLINSICKNA